MAESSPLARIIAIGYRERMTDRVLSGWSVGAMALAVSALLVFLAGPLGVRTGLWTFEFGFRLLRWAVYLGVPAALLALIAGAQAIAARRGPSLALSVAALIVAGVAAGFPLLQYRKAKTLPPINDITTDPSDPPAFVAAGRGAENGAAGAPYPGAEFAEQQRSAYPDMTPLRFTAPASDVFGAALSTVREMPEWEVVMADSTSGRIEATVTTRWFRFLDDVAIRVREGAAGTEVDVRSRSRVGRSDVGANAARIRLFRERLNDRLETTRS